MARPLLRAGAGWATVITLIGCNGDGTGPEPDPPVVTAIDVAGETTLLVDDTTTAMATVLDQYGDAMAGVGVSWSSTNTDVATVSSTGVVTAVGEGNASIVAASEGRSGTLDVNVVTDSRFAYVWASYADSVSYRVTHDYQYSTSGGIVSNRSDVGVYHVIFLGLAPTDAQRTNVQVSAYGTSTEYCKAAGWHGDGTDLVVDVRCFDASGDPGNAPFNVLVTGATALPGRLGFVFAHDPTATAPYVPQEARSARGQGIRVTRESTGAYDVDFDGLARGPSDGPELVLVTAVGEGNEHCSVEAWEASFLDVEVRCYGRDGSPADAAFNLLVVEQPRPGAKLGFTWANDPYIGSGYIPPPDYTLNSAGGGVSVGYTDVGRYIVALPNFARTDGAGETVIVSAYGGNAYCGVEGWSGASPLVVDVRCHDPLGVPTESQFTIVVVQ